MYRLTHVKSQRTDIVRHAPAFTDIHSHSSSCTIYMSKHIFTFRLLYTCCGGTPSLRPRLEVRDARELVCALTELWGLARLVACVRALCAVGTQTFEVTGCLQCLRPVRRGEVGCEA